MKQFLRFLEKFLADNKKRFLLDAYQEIEYLYLLIADERNPEFILPCIEKILRLLYSHFNIVYEKTITI